MASPGKRDFITRIGPFSAHSGEACNISLRKDLSLIVHLKICMFTACMNKQIAQDEMELQVESALGVTEIQPFFTGCYHHCWAHDH